MLRPPHDRPRDIAGLLVSCLLLAAPDLALAQGPGDGMRRPDRLTIGVADQFLGQLAPDGRNLYYLSNRKITREVYHQDLEAGRASLLFDEGADVSWARVSPDGRHLLYISFRDDAAGQLCVRDLPAASDGQRRCVNDGSRAVEALWTGPTEIALLGRTAMQGDLNLSLITVGPRLSARPLLARNMTNPAFSPDGRWLVYVPVERYVERIGPGFAARAAKRLEAVRLDGKGGFQPQPMPLDLPGRTGQPAFSLDGKALYFAQFFNDSNRDGVIDASDNGVLFRVPFDTGSSDAPARAARAFPTQLTDPSWNCQYPSPAAGHLITTCSHGANLDVYSLPPDGLVPGDWDAERLRLEIDLAARPIEQQILYRHLLRRLTDVGQRRLAMMRLVYLHLEAEEFDAAEFYARQIDAAKEVASSGFLPVLLTQIEQRRALRAHERGRLGVGFAEQSRERLAKLDPEQPAGGPSAEALRQVVRSEISDALGDKDGARRELEAAALAQVVAPAVLDAYYRRADALYRELDDPGALWEAARRLSEHPILSADERQHYARAAVRALVRGLPLAEAQAQLAGQLKEAAPESELAFALELSQAALRIRDAQPSREVGEALLALYRRQGRLDRKRAVVLDGVQRASELDAERVIERLAQVYVDDVPRGTRERRRAEGLYRRFLEGRAYRRLAKGHLDHARDDFALVARTTGSFESVMGYIDVRLRQGARPAALSAEYAHSSADHPEEAQRFARAYLLSLTLPDLDDQQHALVSQRVLALLRGAWSKLKSEPTARALFGAVLHEQYLRTGNLALAQRADLNYQVALELVKRNPRYRAMVLGQLGLLQAQVGNFRIALGYLEDREQIPFIDDVGELAHHLVKARTLQHLDRKDDAAKAAEAALAACERTPALAQYRVVALDRAALYSLSAGHFARALALYDAELALLSGGQGPVGARNRLVVRLARAAAALGAGQARAALADLDAVEPQLADRALRGALAWPHTPLEEVLRSYRLLAAGLRAKVHRGLGELDRAARALEARQALARERLQRSQLDEHLQALVLVEAQLAEVALERRDVAGAGRWTGAALGHADEYARRTKVPLDAMQLDVLWLATEVRVSTGAAPGFNLPGRLRAAQERIVQSKDPAWRSYQRLFEIYAALNGPGRGP